MVGSPRSTTFQKAPSQLSELDLTSANVSPSPARVYPVASAPTTSNPFLRTFDDFPCDDSLFGSSNMPRASPGLYNSARRRVYTRRDRIVDPTAPNMVRERLDMAEDCVAPELHPARQSALIHLSRAYAVAGYAQATLCFVSCFCLCVFIVSFSRGLYSDVTRKTRLRATDGRRTAIACRTNYSENRCYGATEQTPALKSLCQEWKACMLREEHADVEAPSATVWAEAVAETFNAFTDRISSTTMAIGLIVVVVLLFFMSSAAFGFMHKRLVDDRLSAPAPSPASFAALQDRPHYSQSGLTPRGIRFDDDDNHNHITPSLPSQKTPQMIKAA